ncbi:FkbM family methyltransferase [Paraburkholderia sp. J67]|uniref:FkbM family methyltransferase n=1 Tax=Paraburkholderia sp. J67 TaxID=2805435 RepID=UPI002ABE555B|nr:FkbM family methyltransferase [Paraburkholderia sp. J67]
MKEILQSIVRGSVQSVKRDLIDPYRLHAQWEQSHLKKLFEHLNVDCVFDIGANQGQYADMLRRRVGFEGHIFSFEPNPEDAAILRSRTKGDDKWQVSETAVSDADGTAQFNVMQSSQFSSLSAPSHDDVDLFTKMNAISKTITVKTERLGTVLSRIQAEFGFKRPFLKMDTQGYDVHIFKGAGDTVREFVGLQSELAIAKLYTDSIDFREAITVYEQGGFSLSALVPNNAGHFPRLLEMDCIMIRADLL